MTTHRHATFGTLLTWTVFFCASVVGSVSPAHAQNMHASTAETSLSPLPSSTVATVVVDQKASPLSEDIRIGQAQTKKPEPGYATREWLTQQASGEKASRHRQTLSGPVMKRIHDGYLLSFKRSESSPATPPK